MVTMNEIEDRAVHNSKGQRAGRRAKEKPRVRATVPISSNPRRLPQPAVNIAFSAQRKDVSLVESERGVRFLQGTGRPPD